QKTPIFALSARRAFFALPIFCEPRRRQIFADQARNRAAIARGNTICILQRFKEFSRTRRTGKQRAGRAMVVVGLDLAVREALVDLVDTLELDRRHAASHSLNARSAGSLMSCSGIPSSFKQARFNVSTETRPVAFIRGNKPFRAYLS